MGGFVLVETRGAIGNGTVDSTSFMVDGRLGEFLDSDSRRKRAKADGIRARAAS